MYFTVKSEPVMHARACYKDGDPPTGLQDVTPAVLKIIKLQIYSLEIHMANIFGGKPFVIPVSGLAQLPLDLLPNTI